MKGLPTGLKTNCAARLPGTPGDLKKQPRPTKYNAVKVSLDGYTFDSKAESYRYLDLRMLEMAGAISGLIVHPEFLLQQAVQNNWHVVRPIVYEADFLYVEADGRLVVEDVKGHETETWKVKEKMFTAKFPEYKLRVLRKGK